MATPNYSLNKGTYYNPIKVFISHSWQYDSVEYNRLTSWLNASNLYWEDLSVPKDNPIHKCGTDGELYRAIQEKVRRADIVMMMAGASSSYSRWIEKEIEIAKNCWNMPILAISPWGNGRESNKVKDNADEVVGWQSVSVINALKKWA